MFGRIKNKVLHPWIGKLSIYETIIQGLDVQGRLIDDRLILRNKPMNSCIRWLGRYRAGDVFTWWNGWSRRVRKYVIGYYGKDSATMLCMSILLMNALIKANCTQPWQTFVYFELMKTEDEQRIRKLVAFAEKHLPLGEIASGPADLPGFGSEYEAHQCLGMLLPILSSYEEVGQQLVATGLWSPVISNRHAALHVLKGWPSEMWGKETTDRLRRLSAEETQESIREQLQEIL
ncbi:hypothetical protein [Paenibacillus sp. BJ-4]|uniref:hypothetical protein n=1 Tax=Paenibacillus sp. BJ-4 TaxID=2878097 RepID=UPI001CF030EE|nr:hypothetical protein [Paenibacillus sp. BJ-4]